MLFCTSARSSDDILDKVVGCWIRLSVHNPQPPGLRLGHHVSTCSSGISRCSKEVSTCSDQVSMLVIRSACVVIRFSVCMLICTSARSSDDNLDKVFGCHHVSTCSNEISICSKEVSMCVDQVSMCSNQVSMCSKEASMCSDQVQCLHVDLYQCAEER